MTTWIGWDDVPIAGFKQARGWRWLGRSAIRGVCIHTAECGEAAGAAGGVASYFTSRPDGSSHIVVDSASIWECVQPQHEAWGAAGGDVNATCFHIEHTGRAAQDAAGWADAYSVAELALSARAAARIAYVYGIPAVRLTPAQVKAGDRGFFGHHDVTIAYGITGDHAHTDPGTAFPWDAYLAEVQRRIDAYEVYP